MALKYAREISTMDTCVRSACLGSRFGLYPWHEVVAIESTARRASNGGVGEKNDSPDVSVALSCRATSRER